MRYEVRPIERWPDEPTRYPERARFRAAWADTVDLLARETDKLGATSVVLQIDATADEIRRDGMIRANARPRTQRVRVAFDSQYGPLTYATDRFDDWRDNVRAIALALQALRAVDRYGVNKRGEQYTGWLALDSVPAAPPMDIHRAAALLTQYGGEKAALKATHPDHGGTAEAFAEVQAARKLLQLI